MERAVAAAFERYDVDHSGAIDRSAWGRWGAALRGAANGLHE